MFKVTFTLDDVKFMTTTHIFNKSHPVNLSIIYITSMHKWCHCAHFAVPCVKKTSLPVKMSLGYVLLFIMLCLQYGLGKFISEVRVWKLHATCISAVTKSTKYFVSAVVTIINCFDCEYLSFDPSWCLKLIFGLMGIFPKSPKSVIPTVCKWHITMFAQNTRPDTQINISSWQYSVSLIYIQQN